MDKQVDAGVIEELFSVIESRKGADPKSSYVASKFSRGVDHIAKKVGEEGVEVALAGAAQSHQEIVSESADLIFHMLILWSATGVAPSEVYAELAGRRGSSGYELKAKSGRGDG